MRNIKNKNIKWWIGFTSCIMLFSIIGIFSFMKMSFLIRGINIEMNYFVLRLELETIERHKLISCCNSFLNPAGVVRIASALSF